MAGSEGLPPVEDNMPAPMEGMEEGGAAHGPPRSPTPSAQTPGAAHRAGNSSQLQGTPGSQGTGGAPAATQGTPMPRGRGRAEFGRQQRRPSVHVAADSAGTGAGPSGTSGDPQLDPEDDLPPADGGDAGAQGHLWGTNIHVSTLRNNINDFIRTFRPGGMDADQPAKYMQIIKEALEAGEPDINVDTTDLRLGGYRQLYDWLIDFPVEVMTTFDRIAKEVACVDFNWMPEWDREMAIEACKLVCRPFRLEGVKHIRDLDPADIDKLITMQGMVTRSSTVIPELRTAAFACSVCHNEVIVENVSNRVNDPTTCAKCGKKWCMVLQHNHGYYTDKQLVKMQESPNDIPEGETPQGVTLYCFDNLVDVCRPGDRVTITGLYRAAPMRVNPRNTALHALFRTYVDVVHVQRDESRRIFTQAQAAAPQEEVEPSILSAPNTPASQSYGAPPSSQGGGGNAPQTQGWSADDQFVALENVTEEQKRQMEEEIKALSRDSNLVNRLIASLAPNIWEMEDIKKGVLCQLFGGIPKTYPGGRIRGELNVLLVGDPSVSKSQLLTYVHQLAPRGIYTSGKGSSAVGLTAYVSKDPETKEMVLESGALVLSDRGVCCIDEFDKMSDSARSMLHEAMEQQTVSVAKAGLISTLNARCSILACANPVGSRYNQHMTIAENINLPSTLLTRFDLIYLVLDKYDQARDRRLARHLVSLFHPGARNSSSARGAELIPQDLLKRYIAYARARCSPKLTDDAAEELVTRYQMLRRDGRERKVVVATPRQLESFIRIAESLARMRLSEQIEADDVKEAVRLWYGAMSGSAASTDGRPDLDNIYLGTTTQQRAAAQALPQELRTLIQGLKLGSSHALSVDELLREVNAAIAAAGQAAQGAGAGTSAGGPAATVRAAGGVSRPMLINALRQIDDLVLFDETTNTVRPVLAPRTVAA